MLQLQQMKHDTKKKKPLMLQLLQMLLSNVCHTVILQECVWFWKSLMAVGWLKYTNINYKDNNYYIKGLVYW